MKRSATINKTKNKQKIMENIVICEFTLTLNLEMGYTTICIIFKEIQQQQKKKKEFHLKIKAIFLLHCFPMVTSHFFPLFIL